VNFRGNVRTAEEADELQKLTPKTRKALPDVRDEADPSVGVIQRAARQPDSDKDRRSRCRASLTVEISTFAPLAAAGPNRDS